MQLWLKYVFATTYADDTSTSISHKLLSKVIQMLEEDALNVLKYMASNGLVANASKTALIFLNLTSTENSPITINVGSTKITQESKAKLLGIIIDENQDWKSQITGQGGMISSLNSRFFLIRRLSNYIGKKRLVKVADSLYTSKIRYGIQLMGKVRTKPEDPINSLLK